ncbi:hypothetical protein BDV12DRAFT_198430 [Aspergillus spectabilis]
MRLTHLLAAGLVPSMASALSRRAVECTLSTTATHGATCESFASSWGLSVDSLRQLNLASLYPNLDTNQSYCVIGPVTDETQPTSRVHERPDETTALLRLLA